MGRTDDVLLRVLHIGYIYYIEILGAKTFLLKATMASEIHATAKMFDLKCAK